MRQTKEQKQIIYNTILNGINSDDVKLNTDQEKLNYAWNRFKSELGHEIKLYGLNKACSNWLQGLALDIPFYNCDVLALAEKTGCETKTERQQDKVLNTYWSYMASAFIQLCKKNKINVYN